MREGANGLSHAAPINGIATAHPAPPLNGREPASLPGSRPSLSRLRVRFCGNVTEHGPCCGQCMLTSSVMTFPTPSQAVEERRLDDERHGNLHFVQGSAVHLDSARKASVTHGCQEPGSIDRMWVALGPQVINHSACCCILRLCSSCISSSRCTFTVRAAGLWRVAGL